MIKKTTRKVASRKKKKHGKKLVPDGTSLCRKVGLRIFKATCFVLAGYMVYVQLKTYCANQDLSTITYERFENEAQDIFPAFSVCAVGWNWIMSEDKMPKNHDPGTFTNILKGNLDDNMNYSKIQFDQVTIDVNKFISDFYTLTDQGVKIIRSKGSVHGKQNSNLSLTINHLDPRRVCVIKEDFQKHSLVQKDYFGLNLYGLNYGYLLRRGYLDLDFYIHQKGQLLRGLKQPNYHLDGAQIKGLLARAKDNNKDVEQKTKIKVVNVDVLQKRANSIKPCDAELQDEDNKIRHSIIEAIGCIPAFHKLFLNQSLLLNPSSAYPICSKAQYKAIYKLQENLLQTKDWYTQPCTTMNVIVTMADPVIETKLVDSGLWVKTKPRSRIDFTFEYSTDPYRVTVNMLAFDMATLWSQIGGFIGIFLGYSILQVPELAESGLRLIKSFL